MSNQTQKVLKKSLHTEMSDFKKALPKFITTARLKRQHQKQSMLFLTAIAGIMDVISLPIMQQLSLVRHRVVTLN